METNKARISEPRRKRKSQQKSIKEDFLNFINSGDVREFIGEEAQKEVYFIADEYARGFFDLIKLPILENKEAYFKTFLDIINKAPGYSNYSPLASDISGDTVCGEGIIKYLYWELLWIILDVKSMLEQKENYVRSKMDKDIQKALNAVKSSAERRLNMKLDGKNAEILLEVFNFCNYGKYTRGIDWYEISGKEIEKYFKIDLGFKKIVNKNGDITKIEPPHDRPTFQEITGIEIDDKTLWLITSFLDFIAKMEYAHNIVFKNRITGREKRPINKFLYELNDIFGLGIKKEINDGLFISLIIDGYLALQEKDEN